MFGACAHDELDVLAIILLAYTIHTTCNIYKYIFPCTEHKTEQFRIYGFQQIPMLGFLFYLKFNIPASYESSQIL